MIKPIFWKKLFALTCSGMSILHATGQTNSTALSGNGANSQGAGYAGVNNVSVGSLAGSNLNGSGAGNTFIGVETGKNCSAQLDNTFIGHWAGRYTGTGDASYVAGANTFVGSDAGYNNTLGGRSDFFGMNAGRTNTTGSYNVFIGQGSGYSNNTTSYNTFLGNTSGYNNVAANNTFIGYYSGFKNTSGTYNVLTGSKTDYWNQTGSNNSVFGYEAAYGASEVVNSHSNNCFFGYRSGYAITTGGDNVFSGYKAGYTNTTGSKNVVLGFEACSLNTTASENVAVGYQAMAKQSYASSATYNVAIGYQALYSNQPTSSTTGYYNAALGYKAGQGNTTGNFNTFLGGSAGYSNTSASFNTYLGYQAGYNTLTGADNTFVGRQAGIANTGSYNTLVGSQSGYHKSGGNNNTLVGYSAGYIPGFTNYSYSDNSYFGYQAGLSTQTGSNNTYMGTNAGYTNVSGTKNVAIGSNAGYNGNGLGKNTYVGYNADDNVDCENCAAIGHNALAAASNKMYFGDANVTECRALSWVSTSDGRFKTNVQENVKGLEFINKLRPVTYNLNTKDLDTFLREKMQKVVKDSLGNVLSSTSSIDNTADFSASMSLTHSGFIAQEVEQALSDCNYKSSIVSAPSHANEPYALSYSEFVIPLVKAVQELSKTQDSLMAEIATLKGGGQRNNESQGQKEATSTIELANNSMPILYQNEPNPFDGSTVIRYFIPENVTGSAFVAFYDMYGKEVNKLELREKGFGKIEANTENLAAGIYSYSIIVNDRAIDTKKMLKSK